MNYKGKIKVLFTNGGQRRQIMEWDSIIDWIYSPTLPRSFANNGADYNSIKMGLWCLT